MSSVKIAFFDVDGTLVDHAAGCIPEKTYIALNRLRENGVRICVATGRPPVCLPDLSRVHVDAFCTFNGSLCYVGSEIIHSNPLLPEDVAKVVQNAAAIGRPVSVAVSDRLAANGTDRDLADYYRLAGAELTVADDFDAVCRESVYQIMLGCREADHEAIIQGTTGVKVTRAWDRAADVIPASGGKGIAIEKILGYFKLNASEAIAFGDGYNDIDMLRAVGTGVAMGNAPAAVKAVADAVCGHVSQDGIYRYCVENGLI